MRSTIVLALTLCLSAMHTAGLELTWYNDLNTGDDTKDRIAYDQAAELAKRISGSVYWVNFDKFNAYCDDKVDGPNPTMIRYVADEFINAARMQIHGG